MTQSSFTRLSSEILHRCECLALHGGDAYPGVLTISARRVSFMPIMESLEGDIEPWSVTVSNLQEVEMGGFEGILTITTASEERKIMGIDLEEVKNALMRLIDGDEADKTDNSKLLVRGPIDIYTSGVLVASGEVLLTNEVFEFRQGRGLEELIWGDLHRVINLNSIKRCEVVGVRRRLEIVTSDETLHFRGPIVNHLYSIMVTLGVGSSTPLSSDLVRSWEASLFSGPIAQKGEVGITESMFTFTPTGMIESLLGVRKAVNVPISHIKRVAIIGVLDKRLVVGVRGARVLNFQISKPVQRMKDLGALMIKTTAKDEPIIAPAGVYTKTKEIEEFLNGWGKRAGVLAKDKLLFMGPGIQTVRDKSLRRGWLILTAKQVAFLPSCGASKIDEPLFADLRDVSKADRSKGDKGVLSLLIGKHKFSFVPAGGNEFIEEFGRCLRGALRKGNQKDVGSDLKPTGTGLVNRRETYRAVLLGGLPLQLSIGGIVSNGPRRLVVAKLRDISLGGCSVITDESLPPRIEIAIEFDIDGHRVVVNGRSIYSIRLGRKKIRWRHGVVFLDMGFGDAQCIRDLVMGLQRESIAEAYAEREGENVEQSYRDVPGMPPSDQ